MTTKFIPAFATAIAIALAGPAFGAETAPPVTGQAVKDDVARAQSLVRQGRFTAALALLLPLVETETIDADALFLYGLASVGAAESPSMSETQRETLLDQAITAFHSMLIKRPELIRVRLELGRAFFLKGEDGLARRHFEQVLAGNPPAAVALNVNRFLNLMRARKRWSLRVGVALAPDTNIGAASDEEIIYLNIGGQSLPFRRDEQEPVSSGIGISAWAGGEYQYPLSPRWRLRAGADVSRREYRGSEFDRMSVSAHLGPRWLIGRAGEASLMASLRQYWLADEPDFRDLGIRAEAGHRLSRQMTANARASWHDRRYDERTHLDGPVTDISLGASYAFGPTLRANLGAGWGRDRTELERYRHDRRWLSGGFSLALPWGFTLGGNVTLRWTDYEGDWSFFTQSAEPRKDITRQLRLNAFNRGFTVQGFSPQVSVIREDRTSNAQLHDYERTSGELRFVRLF